MKLKLDVRINITPEGKIFTVWPRIHKYLPGIEFYTGISNSLIEAVGLIDSIPE